VAEKLKKGWTRVAFGDVVQLCRERSIDPAADGFDRYVGLEHLEPGDLKIRRWGNVADGTTFTNIFHEGARCWLYWLNQVLLLGIFEAKKILITTCFIYPLPISIILST